MKRRMSISGALWGGLAALVLASQPVQAREAMPLSCVLAAIQGSYDFVAPATVSIGPGTAIAFPEHLRAALPAPSAGQGKLVFDDAGYVQLEVMEDITGALDSPTTVAGIYVLETGCTAAVHFDNGAQLALKIVGNGRTSYLVSMTPGFVILRPVEP
jgi:hypothetical protein